MNGNLRAVPDPTTTQMTRELTERAQDKQAAVAMRAQDLQYKQNKAQLAINYLANVDKYDEKHVTAIALALAEVESVLSDKTDVTDPLANLPQEIMVRA